MSMVFALALLALLLAFPLGMLLGRFTKDEQETGNKYFYFLVFLGMVGAGIAFIFHKSELVFLGIFISIVAWVNWKGI